MIDSVGLVARVIAVATNEPHLVVALESQMGRAITLAGNFPPPWHKAELKVGDELILQLVRKG